MTSSVSEFQTTSPHACGTPENDTGHLMTAALTEHSGALRRFAHHLTKGRWDVADDIFQQTCLQAWRNKHRIDYSRCCKPWLLRIMKNEYLQYVRKSVNQHEITDDQNTAGAACTVQTTSNLDLQEILAGLSALPAHQREAIIFVLAYGYTYDEAASLLGSRPGTIKSRVARGREKLAEIISAQNAA